MEKQTELLRNHDVAFMTLGIGRASKASKDELMKVDALVPVAFAKAAKAANINHFSLLSAVGQCYTRRIVLASGESSQG